MKKQKQVFIVGSKGIPAQYGGFETFVEKLTKYNSGDIQYHVACISDTSGSYIHNNAVCAQIKVPPIGSAKAIYYDCAAMKYFINYCKKHRIEQPVFYVLGSRIGPFIGAFRRQIEALQGRLYINPDGQEWKRGKWSRPVKWYWKLSEKGMVKNADMVICDSRAIEEDIRERYSAINPRTLFIPYGAERIPLLKEEKLNAWLEKNDVKKNEYYLLVGRFVPENNFECIIREFMSADTAKKLIIVTGKNSKLTRQLHKNTLCQHDSRIVFAGTIYDEELIGSVRKNAFASFHGHEVGGTNPSLLEGLMWTKVNLVLDVVFNREVAADAALYWSKEQGNLKRLIEQVEKMSPKERDDIGQRAVSRIETTYNCKMIEQTYRNLFLKREW